MSSSPIEMKCLMDARIKEMRVVYIGEYREKVPYVEITALLYPKAWGEKVRMDKSVCVPEVKFKAPFHLFDDPIEKIINEVLGYAIPIMDGTNKSQIHNHIEKAFENINKEVRPESYI